MTVDGRVTPSNKMDVTPHDPDEELPTDMDQLREALLRCRGEIRRLEAENAELRLTEDRSPTHTPTSNRSETDSSSNSNGTPRSIKRWREKAPRDETAAALCASAAEGDVDVLRHLLEEGTDPNLGNYDKRTALHLAAEEGNLDCVELLVQHGAEVNALDRWESSPMTIALAHMHNDVANFLKDRGAVTEQPRQAGKYREKKQALCSFYTKLCNFCGVPDSPQNPIPFVGFAAFLYLETGVNIARHQIVREEVDVVMVNKATFTAQEACAAKLDELREVYDEWERTPRARLETAALPYCSKAKGHKVTSVTISPKVREEILMVATPKAHCLVTFPLLRAALIGPDPKNCKEAFTPLAPHLLAFVTHQQHVGDWGCFIKGLLEITNEVLAGPNDGHNAAFIPHLDEENVDPNIFSFAVCSVEGQQYSYSDDYEFSAQACSWPFVYAHTLEKYGADELHKYVGREPSGRSVTDFSTNDEGKPFNALCNAGCIVTCSVKWDDDETTEERAKGMLDFFHLLSGGGQTEAIMEIMRAEKEMSYWNAAVANFMAAEGAFRRPITHKQIENFVDLYLTYCSLRVNTQMLANMAGTLAAYGTSPLTATKVLSFDTVKETLQVTNSCGMYNASGEWACTVGIPAKSGASGAIFLVVPGVVGLCVRSPRLDGKGNSVRGKRFAELFAERFRMSIFDLIFRAKDAEEVAQRIVLT